MPRASSRKVRRHALWALLGALIVSTPILTPLTGTGAGAAVEDPGLPVEVTLKTDAHGVTHIYADTEYALWYANGYVQARDRLFQMDVLRHVGYGDSAAVIGPSQLASDIQVRRDMYSRAEIVATFDAMPESKQRVLEAYSDGVNRYIAEATARDALPAEFAALGHAPEPWTPYDSVASINYLIGYFGVAGGGEIGNAKTLYQLADSLGSLEAAYAAYEDVNWLRVGADAYTTIKPQDKVVDGGEDLLAFEDVPAKQLELAEAATRAEPFGVSADLSDQGLTVDERQAAGLFHNFHWGSNALLVDGDLTATGAPIMFGGPQMGYYKPPIPYEVGLHGAGYDVVGMGVATAPGVVIGRTPDFAWSVTSGIDDQVDTVALELNPDDYHQFWWDGGWETMACDQVVHRTTPNPGDPSAPRVVTQEVCRARGMPVVAWSPDDHVAFAQRVTTRGKELPGAFMWLSLGKQTDLEGFKDAIATFPFTFNFHYAGPEGVAYIHTGDVPIRDPGLDPRLPALAGTAHDWRGEKVGLGLGTYATDPSTGYFAQWNNAPALGWRAGDSETLWGSVHRVQLLDHFVQKRIADTGGQLTWSDVDEVLEEAATHDPFARHTVPHLVAAADASGDPALQAMAAALDAWGDADYPWRDADGDDVYDDPGHAVWDATRLALQERVFRDELGAETPALVFDPPASSDPHAGDHGQHNNKDTLLVDALNGDTHHAWCDDVTTPAAETCEAQLVAALEDARERLDAAHGTSNVDAWRLPEHKSRFVPIGAGHGDAMDMVNRGSWNQVVAIGQGLAQSGGVLPPGNSGLITADELALTTAGAQAEPPRLTDQLGLYTSFNYKPLPFAPAHVDAIAERVETLVVPAG